MIRIKVYPTVSPGKSLYTLAVAALLSIVLLSSCALPEPPPTNLPTLPAVLDITPAPTLDIDATATAFSSVSRPSPTPAALYIVQSGDTLSGIAERFATTVDEIVAANGLIDPDALQPGQALIIPSLLQTPVVEQSVGPTAETTTPTTIDRSPTPTLTTP
jgi:LysM repeat protein